MVEMRELLEKANIGKGKRVRAQKHVSLLWPKE